jgi:excisionase family DNA binding protein
VKARNGRKDKPAQVGAAEYLGVSVRSVWRLVDAGHLHPVRLPGLRCVAFDVRELDALIEASRD